jgi:hypothetical protein
LGLGPGSRVRLEVPVAGGGIVLELVSTAVVPGARAAEVLRFLLEPTDSAYRSWWPGVHDRLHITVRSGRADHVGDRVLMDELVGRRRLRFAGRVVEVVADRRVVWQLHQGVPLPVRLRLDLEDDPARGGECPSVRVRHTVRAGWAGSGRIADPLFRLYLSSRFAADLDEHVRTEFARLGAVLRGGRSG